MRIREFMSTNVLTVSSDTSITEARKFMVTHKVSRLPVVDKGKLVGMVSFRKISEASPSSATTLSVWEMNHLLAKMTVGELMRKNIITVSPSTTAESALAIAQENKVGSLPVIENGRLVGIVTTNDFVYRIMNPLLGLDKPGVRIHIFDCGETKQIEEAVSIISRNGHKIEALHIDDSEERETRDLIIQINTADPDKVIADIVNRGYTVEIRERKSWPIPEKHDY